MAPYTSSVVASPMPKSSARVVVCHQRVVASLEAGRTARATTSARARSRSAQAGPIRRARPTLSAIAQSAATWPCGKLRSTCTASPAPTRVSPASTARKASIPAGGRAERFARVSCCTRPPSRKDRRSSQLTYSRSLYLRTTLAMCIA